MQRTINKDTDLPVWYKVIIMILVLVFILLGFAFREEWEDCLSSHYYKETSMGYRLDDADYYGINNYTVLNEIHGYENTGTMAVYAAVGKYYYQAVQYYALKAVGNVRAKDYLERMETYRGQMGEYAEHGDVIDEVLKQ